MTAVLQRLAARVLPAPGAVRARLGSRFEGFSGSAEPGAVEPGAVESGPVEFGPVKSGAVECGAAESEFGHAPAAVEPELRRATHVPRRPEEPSASVHAPGSPEIAAPPAPLLPPLADVHNGATSANSRAANVPRHQPSVVDPVASNDPVPMPPAGPAGFGTAPVAAGRPSPRPSGASLQAPSKVGSLPESEKLAPPGGRPEAPLLSPRPPSSAMSHEPLAPAAAAPAAAAPDIQVSIGRIEIRAERSDARPQRAAPPRPSLMSLKDYLGKGRGRR